MDMQAVLVAVVLSLAVAAASAATWAACRWWYGRQLVVAAIRLQKSDKGRLFSQQQTQQARNQVETLKAELAALQQAAAETEATRRKARELQAALLAAERSAAPESAAMPLAPAHGFADTQVMP